VSETLVDQLVIHFNNITSRYIEDGDASATDAHKFESLKEIKSIIVIGDRNISHVIKSIGQLERLHILNIGQEFALNLIRLKAINCKHCDVGFGLNITSSTVKQLFQIMCHNQSIIVTYQFVDFVLTTYDGFVLLIIIHFN